MKPSWLTGLRSVLPPVKREEMKLSSCRSGKAVTPLRNKPNITMMMAMRIFLSSPMRGAYGAGWPGQFSLSWHLDLVFHFELPDLAELAEGGAF